MPAPTLSLRQLNRATLARQGLRDPLPGQSVARLVERLGSLQAQPMSTLTRPFRWEQCQIMYETD